MWAAPAQREGVEDCHSIVYQEKGGKVNKMRGERQCCIASVVLTVVSTPRKPRSAPGTSPMNASPTVMAVELEELYRN